MTMPGDDLAVRVHLAGFSRHELPFHYVDQRDGLTSYLFRLQTEGYAKALVGGRVRRIEPGDLLLYRPGDPYELDISGEGDGEGGVQGVCGHVISGDYYVYCSGTWLDEWWKERDRPGVARIPLDDRLTAVWRQVGLEQFAADARSHEIASHLLKTLCLMIDRMAEAIGSISTAVHSFIPYRMRAYIDERMTTHFSIKEVADHVGLSESRAMALFTKTFGKPMKQYAMDARLNLARNRIAYEDMALDVVAQLCGFQHYTHFYRVFRRQFGQSPSEFRREHR